MRFSVEFDSKRFIRETKLELLRRFDLTGAFSKSRDMMLHEVETIRAQHDSGVTVIPQVEYRKIAEGAVEEPFRELVRRRGCVIVKGVFDRTQVGEWNHEIGEYIDSNDYLTEANKKKDLDQYFSALENATPQIFSLYWSRPQVMARQAESMATTKRFLNRLYDISGPMGPEFDPENDFAYADRIRRRQPGDTTLGLSPHMDSGSYERWCDPAYQAIYSRIYEGDIQGFDPWRAAFRTQTREYASPSVCSMFRTFQGWTALTPQGPGDGTLSLLPIAKSIAYFLLRALQKDVADDDLCGALPGRALGASQEWHNEILEGLISIPTVEPGDTVWWHPDVIHSVANEHQGNDYANVIYVGASPVCAKNEAYARRQADAFHEGRSAPDFASEDYEVNFEGRATVSDLTELGRRQLHIA